MADPVDLKPVYLITGSDRPKIELAVKRLRSHFEPESIDLVSAQEASGAEVVNMCNAGSLFGDGRLVVVDGVDGRRNADDRLVNAWKAAEIAEIVTYLESPAPGTTLALLAQELKKDAALFKTCAKAGQVLEFSHAKRQIAGWVAERFRASGVKADTGACLALVQLVGDRDLHALANEIDKIVTWAQGEPVGEREVEQLVASSAETPSFTLTDAWAQRDTARALEATEAIFEREGKPRRDTAPRLAGSLGNHLSRMRQLKRLAAEGVPPREAAAKLKMHPFYGEKVYRQAEGFSADELGDATVRLADLDLALKGGSRLAPDLELQRALIDISREPGRAERR
jgi:DNA polymerase-3 subunit delta